MKKILFFHFLLLCFCFGVKAQNDSVAFTGTGISVIYTPTADTVFTCYQAGMAPVVSDPSLYFWSWSPATYLNTASSDEVISTPLDTITYIVTGTPLDSITAPYSAQVTVIPYSAFELDIVYQDDHCTQGLGMAEVVVSNNDTTDVYTYSWNNGDTNAVADSLVAAKYIVTVLNQDGCLERDTVQINDIPSIFTLSGTVTNVSCFACNDGAIDLSASVSPASALSFTWSNGPVTEDISGLIAGTYIVIVTDAFNCTATDTFEVQDLSGIEDDHFISSLKVYPIPASENITVSSAENIDRVEIYCIEGRLLETVIGNANSVQVISAQQWTKGIYCLRVFAGNKTAVRYIIKE